ncbi:MAG: hypothetical protein AB1521_05405 [Bacteroidota bacterium]
MRKYISPFVCGFGAGVLQVVPVAKSLACCFIIPLAAFLSLYLELKANPSSVQIQLKKGLIFGLLTGLFAALFGSFFDIFITLLTKNNDIVAAFPELQKMINGFPLSEELKKEVLRLFNSVRNEILRYGFSPLYTISVLINNLVINSIFGMIGGLVGTQVINSKFKNQN